ncbi:MAG TPA: glycosyltransferase [Thermoanaerobaculia bacterium]|jgi:glycosyltransferase involved in cell wall biosynthesis
MRVLFVSRWKFNPYQKRLVAELRAAGVEVIERDFDAASRASTIAEERPDVLHLQNIHAGLRSIGSVVRFMHALLVTRIARVKVVWTVHDLQDHDNRTPRLDAMTSKFTSRFADALIVHCDAVHALVRNANVTTIHHGQLIDEYPNHVSRGDARRELGLGHDDFVFLLLGWIRAYKGIADLIDAFERLELPGARLLLAGSAAEDELRMLVVRRASANARILFHPGAVDAERVQLYLNACDVVVLPYRRILTSGAPILAMSFAKPCIAVRRGCMDAMLDEEGSFLYEPDAADALLHAMQRAFRERESLEAMGRHNLQRVASWRWDEIAAQTIGVYRSVLRPSARGAAAR